MPVSRAKGRGRRNHWVTVQTAGEKVSDGSGGYTVPYTDADPAGVWAAIETSAGPQEAVGGNVERASITQSVEMDWHPDVTSTSRLVLGSRYFYVIGVMNEDELNHTLFLTCEERA